MRSNRVAEYNTSNFHNDRHAEVEVIIPRLNIESDPQASDMYFEFTDTKKANRRYKCLSVQPVEGYGQKVTTLLGAENG
jgi:hypothetical protein